MNTGNDSFPLSSEISQEVIEKRHSERIKHCVDISIKNLRNSRETYAKSIDISQGGLGITFNRFMKPGDKLELWIHLSDGLKPIHRFGELIWFKRIKPFLYRGGIKFIPGILT